MFRGLTREFVSQAYGIPLDDVAKLGSAENPFGPSPKAAAAVKAAMMGYWTARALREKIAAKYGYAADRDVRRRRDPIIYEISAPWRRATTVILTPAFPIYHMAADAPVFVGMGDDLDFKWGSFTSPPSRTMYG